jgi:branched-chain amino acid transport system substrate-binding protein
VAGVLQPELDGYEARIDAQNAAGGINGVKIKVINKDDQFTPAPAKANALQFLESDHVNSLMETGDGQVAAIASLQNADCVPLLYAGSDDQTFRDVNKYPFTLEFLSAAVSETIWDVKYIESKFPSGATVGIAEDPDATGVGEAEAFQAAAKGSNLTITTTTSSADPNSAATALAAAKVDVVYDAGIATDCGPVAEGLANIGFKPKLVLNPANCADETIYTGAGTAVEGNVVPFYAKDPTQPALKNDAGLKEYVAQMDAAGYKGTAIQENANSVSGWMIADLTVHTLEMAAASPAGLSDVGVVEAARDMTYESPMAINTVQWVSAPSELTGFAALQAEVWSTGAANFVSQGAPISVLSH